MEADAIVARSPVGVFVDHRKVHPIDFAGRFFASRSAQHGTPGARPAGPGAGWRLAAGAGVRGTAHDPVIAAVSTIAEMKEFRGDMRRRLAAQGRDPDSLQDPSMSPRRPLGETNEEARARSERRQRRWRQRPATRFHAVTLAMMASLTDIDFSTFDIDAPIGVS